MSPDDRVDQMYTFGKLSNAKTLC